MAENLRQYLCFKMDEAYYLVEVDDIVEICTRERLESKLTEEEARKLPFQKRACLVILKNKEGKFAVEPDEMEGVIQVNLDEKLEMPKSLASVYPWTKEAFLKEGRLLFLLNTELPCDAYLKGYSL